MAEEKGRKGGRSFTGKLDMRTKTARPTSVGPHHARDKQEDPSNPGIRPEEGYAAEIARNNAAASQQPGGAVAQKVKPAPDRTAPKPEETEATSNPPRGTPPLRGTAKE
ncbi:hypothetical protein [Falsiroseomonas oryziterrae]|uniref:hypothetical protein n=1 Tax=Falsiroseomonas oryziterrae TaxID=2911368 RepID=UPI001F44CFC4|nr:hypothetical protein [Roseomonas sp. NPKOSM-4]